MPDITGHGLTRSARVLALGTALVLVPLLFWAGRQPFAAGLLPGAWAYLGHTVFYALLTVLVWLAHARPRPLAVVAVVAAVGAADELHQATLPGRHGSVVDFALDVAVAVAVLVAGWLHRRSRAALAK